jgi:integrase/recombinase XerD
MTLLAPHVAVFFRQRLAQERGASENTCDTYALTLRLLFEFAAKTLRVTPCALTLEQIDAPLVLDFLTHLEEQRHNVPATRNVRLAAIRSFMHFIEYRVPSALEQVRRILAIAVKKTDTRLITHLTVKEVEAILDAPDPATREGIRDRAMLTVAVSAGLRASELLGLRLDNLSFEPRLCIRVQGKGRRERALPLWKAAATALRAWLAARPPAPAQEVFLNARGGPMSRSGFEYVLHRHVTAATDPCHSLRGKRVSPHVLRHTCAMMILQATGDIRKVALWLGHASLQTTEIYLRADPTQMLDAINPLKPLDLRKGHFRPPDELIALLTKQ